MLDPVRLPHRVRSVVSLSFHHFGLHCATHPKRVILISCVVLTSLFYPALAPYSSSNPTYSLGFLSSLFDAYQSDLHEIWEGHDALHVLEDAATRARCGMERTLRIERVLVPSSERTAAGAATPATLQFASNLGDRIGSVLRDAQPPLSCVRMPNKYCLTLSPLLLFERGVPSTPTEVLKTINASPNISIADIQIGVPMLFSGRSFRDDHLDNGVEHVTFLALTYFFLEKDCLASDGHERWLKTLETTTMTSQESSVTPFVYQKPRFLALQYDPSLSRPSHFSAISLLLYLSYLGVFLSFSGSLRRMDTVHSRFGLTFTALVEIVASTIASVSVCALAGFRITMVPWGILPVIIVFVGAENMFLLVDAVTSTSVTLSLKQRIGTGLAVAGTSNTLNTVSYNAILGVIAFFATGAIRQFCSFAIVLLVAHWFLIHTFFVAVLSIDLQRLELSDMLTQDKASKPTVPLVASKSSNEPLPSKRRQTMNQIQQRLRVVPTKNGSLVLMLAVTVTLYYVTYPFPNRPTAETDPLSFLQHAMRRPPPIVEETSSPALSLWNTLNPEHDPLVNIRIEMPMVVAQTIEGATTEPRRDPHQQNIRSHEPMARRAFWLLKIVILPIGTTTGCLYLLLLYLLKDAELLEAQRNRPEPNSDDPTGSTALPVAGNVTFTTLPRTFATDVEFIATNHNATVVAIGSAENELVIWNGRYHKLDVCGALSLGSSSSGALSCITHVALDFKGRYCAIGMSSGVVCIWNIPIGNCPVDTGAHPSLITFPTSIADLAFVTTDRCRSRGQSNTADKHAISPDNGGFSIVATCDNGMAFHTDLTSSNTVRSIHPSHTDCVLRSHLLRVDGHGTVYVAYTYYDGTAELFSPMAGYGWESMCLIQPGSQTDPVAELSLDLVKVNGSSSAVLGAATSVGRVSLWDPTTGACISLLDNAFGDVTRLRIAPMISQPCQRCGEYTPDGFALTFSVGHTVFVYRASLSSMAKRCTCPVTRKVITRGENFGRRSRSTSTTSASSSPSRTRLKLPAEFTSVSPSLPDAWAFPISGHGVHSRRASAEKDTNRRTSELLPVINSESEHLDVPSHWSPSFSKGSQNNVTVDSVWRSLVVEQLTDISCERGGWGLIDGRQLIGLRRRSRLGQTGIRRSGGSTPSVSAPRGELTASVLERWELWTFNPSKPDAGVRVSSLLALTPTSSPLTRGSLYPRLPFTRVYPMVVGSSSCVAGFGNTAGIIDFSHQS